MCQVKKVILTIIGFAILHLATFSQDKIITHNYDTIDCRIIHLDKKEIVFQITTKEIISNGVLPLSDILKYLVSSESFNSLVNQEEDSQSEIEQEIKKTGNDLFVKTDSRFSFHISTGYGYLTASSSQAANGLVYSGYEPRLASVYYKKFRNAFLSELSFKHTLFEYKKYALAWGVTYMNQMNSSSIWESIELGDGVHFYNATYEEKVVVNHFGLLIRHTFFINNSKRTNVFYEGGSGLVIYRNEFCFANNPILIKAFAPGSFMKFGFETHITKKLAINLDAGYYLAILKNFTTNNGFSVQQMTLPDGMYESLGKITLNGGISYKF